MRIINIMILFLLSNLCFAQIIQIPPILQPEDQLHFLHFEQKIDVNKDKNIDFLTTNNYKKFVDSLLQGVKLSAMKIVDQRLTKYGENGDFVFRPKGLTVQRFSGVPNKNFPFIPSSDNCLSFNRVETP